MLAITVAMTLYLKYRSQRISELDTKSVREMLGKLVLSKDLPHAFLFCGPRGTGKTSAARILAKAVNCPNKDKAGEPCNECEMCKTITAGTAPDVIEIDAASNRGIDEMRELRERVRLSPLIAKVKVYIIDEVHMLTIEAANALLKTLEEPPTNTLFILCTTDPHKLPDTVVSRCMVVQFPKPTLEEIVQKLDLIVKQEKLKVDDLLSIARAAKGSFRDAIKMVEQSAISGQKVAEALGAEDFFESIGDRGQALMFVNKLAEQGVEMRSFVEKLVELTRERMLLSKNPEIEIQIIEGLEKVYEQMRTTTIPQLPLEIWVLGNTTNNTKITNNTNTINNTNTTNEYVNKKSIEIKNAELEVKEVVGDANLEELEKKWSEIMKKVKVINNSVEALLRSTKPTKWDGKKVELEVFYKFHKDKLESEKCRMLVEGVVGEVMKVSTVRLVCVLTDKKHAKPSDNIEGSVDDAILAAAQEIFKTEVI